jgi:hypothetical protein
MEIWPLSTPQRRLWMTPSQVLILLLARLRQLRKMAAWVPWATRLVDRLTLVLLPRWSMRLMRPLAPRWMGLWIKVVRPRPQIRQELRRIQTKVCPLKTLAQR